MNSEEFMKEIEKQLDAIDPNDLIYGFRGITIDEKQWEKYQAIVKILIDIQNKYRKGLDIRYMDSPYSQSAFADVKVILTQPAILCLDGEAKKSMLLVFFLCDQISMTLLNGKVRINFIVDNIWKEWEEWEG